MYTDWKFRLGRIAADRAGDRRMRGGESAREIERLVSVNRERIGGGIDVGVICGSGLAGIVDILEGRVIVPEQEIRGDKGDGIRYRLPASHGGTISRSRVLIFEKRSHIYEGYSAWDSTIPVRVLAALDARRVVLTCSAGSLRASLGPGSILLVRDHINLSFHNPGRGLLYGPSRRFVDLRGAYSGALADRAREVALANGIPLREGVLVTVSGPNYETKAEARMLRTLGADVVCMSMVSEAIVSRMFDLEVLGLTAVTNYTPMNGSRTAITHDEVLSAGRNAVKPMSTLIDGVIRGLGSGLMI